MHLKLLTVQKIFAGFLLGLITISGLGIVVTSPVSALTSAELQAEIDKKQAELNKTKNALATAEKNLKNVQSSLNSSQGELPRLQNELKKIEAEIAFNSLQIKSLSEESKLKELQQEDQEIRQDNLLVSNYLDWRSDNKMGSYLNFKNPTNPLRSDFYQRKVFNDQNYNLEEISSRLDEIKRKLGEYKSDTASLTEKSAQLAKRKAEVEAEIARLNQSLNSNKGVVAGIRGQVSTLQASIAQLSAEQKSVQAYEAWLLAQANGSGNQQVMPGQYYFSGKGRDAYQGHGVGMSQFGAFGAAKKGWSAAQILQYYYKDTKIEARAGSVSVQGYGTMDSNKYAAGLGEVPSKACGNATQAAERPDKYVIDNTNSIWDCWPEEAIKAQVIAARSYARSYGGTLCTTASCQVYTGGNGKKWAADETKDMVVVSTGSTHNGKIIQALYSSDNNQGNGTADNDTVFSNMSGVGTPYSYLRHVNDTAVAASYSYTNWSWRTNGYTMAQITEMLKYVKQNSSLGYAHTFINGVVGDIGSVSAITFVRDGSQRVKKVKILGTSGKSREIAGWLFKAIWNAWVYNKKPSGQIDYIYSLTFYLNQN